MTSWWALLSVQKLMTAMVHLGLFWEGKELGDCFDPRPNMISKGEMYVMFSGFVNKDVCRARATGYSSKTFKNQKLDNSPLHTRLNNKSSACRER
jgi:hypothetical protein